MKKTLGFTLIELMIVVAVVAVLAGIAITTYGKQIRKAKRAEAKQVLADWVLREEKYRSNNASYATCDLLLAPTTCANFNLSPLAKNYTFSVTTPTATGYTLSALPKGDQAKDTCSTLSVTMATGTLSKSPTTPGCWQ